jgi:hypothetical protein
MPALEVRLPSCMIVPQDHRLQQVDLNEPLTDTGQDFEYFINTIKILVRDYGARSCRFFIVFDPSCPIAQCDDDTVVFLYGDEKCRIPVDYADARLLLPCYGFAPYFPERLRPSLASLLDFGRFGKERLQSWLRCRTAGPDTVAAIQRKTLIIPLGYSQQRELPIKPIRERRFLASFAGSIRNLAADRFSPKWLTGVPKAAARRAMVKQLQQFMSDWPQHQIWLTLTDHFEHSLQVGGAEYSRMLMDTVVCIAPRGTRMETWRIFEGLRYGCVVVSQRLPDRWFYRGSPIIQIESWDELAAILEDLISDPVRLEELHQRGLAWWRNVCSPDALALRIAPLLRRDNG